MGLRGKHTKLWVDGYALTAKTSEIQASLKYDEVEESAYGEDHSTLKGQADATVNLNGYFSPDTGEFHDAVNSITDSTTLVSTVFGENAAPALGDIALVEQVQQIEYNINPNLTGVLAAMANFRQKGSAPEFGVLLADATVTANGNSSSIDDGDSSSNGAAGVLHISGVSAGDSITVLIEDSANDSDWATLITFTLDGSAIGSERIEVSGDVDQYVRASYTVTGADVSFDIAVIFIRK